MNRKMEEKELKQRFFAQYWGQFVLCTPHQDIFRRTCKDYSLHFDIDRDAYLILKDLYKVTKEDAEKADLNSAGYLTTKFDFFGEFSAKESDILRSLGYLVPFMGLSIDDIIKKGWAKYE